MLTLLGREVPELEAELLFTAAELGFLHDYAREHGLPAPDTRSSGAATDGFMTTW